MKATSLRNFWAQSKALGSFVNRQKSPFTAGQPLYETRPFQIKPGEITAGITALEYHQRRVELASRLPDSSVAIVVGNTVQYASGSVFHPFQQNNDLFYLSGWNEPDSVIAIEKPDSNLDNLVFHMIVPPKEPHAEQWDGARTGVEGVKQIFNADEAGDIYRIGPLLEPIIQRNKNIYIDLPNKSRNTASPASTFNNFFSIGGNSRFSKIESILDHNGTGKNIKSISPYITDLRAIKSEAELAVMRAAGKASGWAYNQAYAKRIRTERTLKSFLEYRFIGNGCDKSAYIPVVAGGENALCIHYTRNDDLMFDDELVLVDAAGSLGGYCADISRTWPVSGKFSGPQKELYQAVLNVEKSCIEQCVASNNISLQDLHDLSVSYLKRELRNAGFGSLTTSEINRIYPHYIGHNLGLDVHDVPTYSRVAKLREGQVVTVEPGVYIPDDPKYPRSFRGMGIRIEDDVAVGKDTNTILTVEAAKEIVDIERIAETGVTTPLPDEILSIL